MKSDDDFDLENGSSVLRPEELQMLKLIDCQLSVRFAFIRKVYSILSVQLLVTFGFILVGSLNSGVKSFLQTHAIILWVALGLSIVFIIALACVPAVRLNYPTNMIILFCFTILESYILAAISSLYETTSVIQAIAITIAITIGLTLYTFQSKRDFSVMGGGLYVVLMVFIFASFMRLFLPSSPILDTVWAGIGALIFSAYIVYDTFMLLNKLSPNDYVGAALSLYLDIINLFIYILELIGKRN